MKSFYDSVFVAEGGVFEGFSFDWASFKKLILKEIFQAAQKLKTFNILDVPDVLPKVADTMAKMGIKVGWIDRVLREMGAKRDHFTLLQEARMLRVQLEELL